MLKRHPLGKFQHDGFGKDERRRSHACPMAGDRHRVCLALAARTRIITIRHALGFAASVICRVRGNELIDFGLRRHDRRYDARDAHDQGHNDDQQSAHERLSNMAAASQQLPGTKRHAASPIGAHFRTWVAKDCLNCTKTSKNAAILASVPPPARLHSCSADCVALA